MLKWFFMCVHCVFICMCVHMYSVPPRLGCYQLHIWWRQWNRRAELCFWLLSQTEWRTSLCKVEFCNTELRIKLGCCKIKHWLIKLQINVDNLNSTHGPCRSRNHGVDCISLEEVVSTTVINFVAGHHAPLNRNKVSTHKNLAAYFNIKNIWLY